MNNQGRESNIELLRIIAMAIIIIFHITVHCVCPELTDSASIDAFRNGFFNEPYFFKKLLIIETFRPLGKTGNAVFMLISGFFLIEKGNNIRIYKTITKLITQVGFAIAGLIIISFLYYSIKTQYTTKVGNYIDFVSLQSVDKLFSEWWFIGYYLCVFIIGAVWLNEYLIKLSKENYINLLLILFAIVSIGWSGVLLDNLANGGRTLFTGIFLYSLGGFIKKYNPLNKLRWTTLILIFVITYVFVWLSYYNLTVNQIQMYFQGDQSTDYIQVMPWFPDYSIVPMVLGVTLFEGFRRLQIPKVKGINYLAQAIFMIYMIHDNDFTRRIWREKDMVGLLYYHPFHFVFLVIKMVLIVYLTGTVFYLCYRLFISLLKHQRHLFVKE